MACSRLQRRNTRDRSNHVGRPVLQSDNPGCRQQPGAPVPSSLRRRANAPTETAPGGLADDRHEIRITAVVGDVGADPLQSRNLIAQPVLTAALALRPQPGEIKCRKYAQTIIGADHYHIRPTRQCRSVVEVGCTRDKAAAMEEHNDRAGRSQRRLRHMDIEGKGNPPRMGGNGPTPLGHSPHYLGWGCRRPEEDIALVLSCIIGAGPAGVGQRLQVGNARRARHIAVPEYDSTPNRSTPRDAASRVERSNVVINRTTSSAPLVTQLATADLSCFVPGQVLDDLVGERGTL